MLGGVTRPLIFGLGRPTRATTRWSSVRWPLRTAAAIRYSTGWTLVTALGWVRCPILRQHGVGLFTVVMRGPDHRMDDLRRWLTWRDEQNAP